MKAIVTGGIGFIGSHLVEALVQEGHEVIVIDNFSTGRESNLNSVKGKYTMVEADTADSDKIIPYFKGIDWVFHLAGLADIVPSIERPLDYFHSNVQGTLGVLEASRRSSIKKFIYAASSTCYGIPDVFPTPETAEICPQFPYALTKNLGEQMVLHWGKVYKVPAVSLRLFNVYGPRARTSGTYGAVFGVFLAQKLAGKPFTVVGNGTQTRDFTYVSDVVQAFLQVAQSSIYGEIFNIGSGNTYSVNRLVELMQGDVVYVSRRPGEPDCTFADTSKIQKLLGWKPEVTFEEGVQKMLDQIDHWKEAPVWSPESISQATEEWFEALS